MRKSIVRFLFVCGMAFLSFTEVNGQIYELKDHRPDTSKKSIYLADTTYTLADSVWSLLSRGEWSRISDFTPSYDYLASTFDSMQIRNNPGIILVKQRYIIHNLQKQYLKMQKQAAKHKIKLNTLELIRTEYEHGINDKGHQFAYITYFVKRRNKEFKIRILFIKLLDHWFMGDELSLIL